MEAVVRHARMLVSLGLLGAYVVQLAIVAPRHEPWFDEAQAWLLARDSGVWELLSHRLRYEGTPGLWHLMLMVPARLGLPFWTAHLLAAGAAVAAAILLLRYSPLPRWLVGLVLSPSCSATSTPSWRAATPSSRRCSSQWRPTDLAG